MSFASGLAQQIEVVNALLLRETRTRFGAHNLGYLWALLEPILMIITFVLLLRFGNRAPPTGMDMFGFVSTGLIPYALFMNSLNRVAESINGNRGLLFYPVVRPLDLVYARALLEFVTYSAIFVLILGGNALYRQQLAVDNALMVMCGLVMASALGTTIGLILCTLALYSNFVERARAPLLRPLFWISGIFFSANQLPDNVREWLLHNPVLHCVEYVRGGWYATYDPIHASPGFVLSLIVLCAALGLSLERRARRRIEVT